MNYIFFEGMDMNYIVNKLLVRLMVFVTLTNG